jgi:hypothetical protein
VQRAESAILICDEGIDGSLIWEVADVLDESMKHIRNGLDPNDLESMLGIEMTFSTIVGADVNQAAGVF